MGPSRLLLQLVSALCLWTLITATKQITDLTHKLDPSIPVWPSAAQFTVTNESPAPGSDGGSRSFCMLEHTGTHIDAPYHFNKFGHKLHAISIERFIGPGVVVNIKDRALKEHRTEVTKEDLEAWEEEHGTIPEGSIVLMASGWSSRWTNAKNYFGGDELNVKNMKFPGFSVEAAEFLINRKVSGVGVDTASVDVGGSMDYPTHKILSKSNVYIIENLNKVEELPASGFTIYAIPIYLKDGTGAPARVFAIEDEDDDDDVDTKTDNDTNFAFGRLTGAGLVIITVLVNLLPALFC